MKIVLFQLLFLFTITIGYAQIVDIPDANFKDRLVNFNVVDTDLDGFPDSDVDLNDDGEIQAIEAEAVLSIIIGAGNLDIFSVEGLQSFINLEKLQITSLDITELPIDNLINLTEVRCWGNNITSINANNLVNLEVLICEDNAITTLLVSNAINLTNLNCSHNELTNLEVSQLENLIGLNCDSNSLTSIDVNGLTNLNYFYCHNNDLTSVNTSGAINLEFFNVSGNNLQSVSVDHLPNLVSFACAQNPLSALTFQEPNSNLTLLSCQSSDLTSLDVSNLPNLEYLNAGYNNLTQIDLNNQSNLIELNVRDNLLEQVFIKNGVDNSELTTSNNLFPFTGNPNIDYFCIDESERAYYEYYQNAIGNDDVVINTYCSFEPGGRNYAVNGESKIDTNTDGCDNSDPSYPNMMFNISDGTDLGYITSNALGFHSIPFSDGSYTITPSLEYTDYFSIDPTEVYVSFPNDANPYNQDFCLTPNGVYKDLEVFVIPLEDAIPGFEVTYKIVYRNVGSVTLSGEVTFDYGPDSDYMQYLGSDPSETTNVNDVLSWEFIDLTPFEVREIFVTFNLNTPTDPDFPLILGDALNYEVIISPVVDDETPNNNDFGFKHIVVNSFDPNDIRCLEGESILPERVGDYVHYLIRFENLGTANATNIVVNNPIDITKFDISTLIPLNGSHDFYTRINPDNDVEFIFENIQLPFDDANNDGYLTYKIKTLESLELGDTFSNSAEIYFDFNAPVITNTYTTLVSDGLSTNEFNILDVRVFPNPVNHNLTIESATVLDKAIVYDVNGREVLSSNFEDEYYKLDLTALESGFYILKVFSVSGNKTIEIVKR